MPLALPAVTVPPARNAGFSEASFSAVVSGRGCSSRSTPATGTSSSANRPAASAAAHVCCERSANASWSSRETPHRSATFSPVSPIASVENLAAYAGFTNRQPSVVSCSVRSPRSNGFVGFGGDQRRARHRLDAAGHEQVAVARDDRVAGAHHGAQSRGAEAVHRHAADAVGQTGEQRGEPRDVAVVLARLVGAAEPHVLDVARRRRRCARPRRRWRRRPDRRGARRRGRRRSGRRGCGRRRG